MLKRCLVLSALLGGLFGAAHAQSTPQSLPELVREAGSEWMIGNWSGTTDDGGTLVHSFTWDLDKHVIVMRGKAGELEYLGVTALDSASREARYVGYDSRGTVSKGAWSQDGEALVLKLESDTPDRGKRTWAVSFVKAGSADLEVRMHGVDGSGNVIQPPGGSITLKRSTK